MSFSSIVLALGRGFCLSIFLVCVFGLAQPAAAQGRPTPPASVLLHELRKLQHTSAALYVAAHPDDENTRLISYLANEKLAETAYLSFTRGDGGQNLIGPELREGLGVIRTQELLAARRIDGGTQFFSRANDFGFSKHPDETFTFWNRDSILADAVWVIRKWQPDVIVARFDPESAGQTHGHHTASGMLAVEAFHAAADPKRFPEQLRHGVQTWQATRVFLNTSWWFYGSEEAFAKADKSALFTVDAGPYYPLLGTSNGEMAAHSRSQHASQGFGSAAQRGSESEYLKLLAGANDEQRKDLFAGVDQTWNRVAGGAALAQVLAKAEQNFDVAAPSRILPQLLEAQRLLKALPAGRYRDSKLPKLNQLIADVLGIYVEAIASDSIATPGQQLNVNYELIARNPGTHRLEYKGLSLLSAGASATRLDTSAQLLGNVRLSRRAQMSLGGGSSNPYWLEGVASEGMYAAPGFDLRGLGENPPAAKATFALLIDGAPLELAVPVQFKRTYPDRGELYRPLAVVPALSVGFTESVYVLADAKTRDISVRVEPLVAGARKGTLRLVLPKGWRASPSEQAIDLASGAAAQTFRFQLTPTAAAGEFSIGAYVEEAGGQRYDRDVKLLRYAHIPLQVMAGAAEAKAVRLDLVRAGKRIGYIAGAGDAVPEALRSVGYTVDALGASDMRAERLDSYDAVVLGVRAYNTETWLLGLNQHLLEYVKRGGTMVVQYNTERGVDMDKLAPFPMKLSRDRVTVEDAPVSFVDPGETVLNKPNKLGQPDFAGWVQERGLYYPKTWDDRYRAVLEMRDPGEEATRGALLVADYGEGHYVYTGLSFFRELPAGVPGAYRLFVNLLEL